MRRLFLLLLVAVSALCLGAGKRGGFTISFHLQGSEHDGEKFVFKDKVAGNYYYFKKVPEIMSSSVVAFQAFKAKDGDSFGAVLKLDRKGRNRLDTLTSTAKGRLLRTVVTRKNTPTPIDVMLIDKTINDGVIVIWKGLTPTDIKEMKKQFNHLEGGPSEEASADPTLPRVPKPSRR